MGLRAQPISDAEFSRQAVALKAQSMASMDAPPHDLGIRRIQEIFRANADRLYHWADAGGARPRTTWPSGICGLPLSPAKSVAALNRMPGLAPAAS